MLSLLVLGAVRLAVQTQPQPQPQTVFADHGWAEAFAASGERFVVVGGARAWHCSTVQIGTFTASGSRAVTKVGNLEGGDGCYSDVLIALGGGGAVWGGFVDCCNSGLGYVVIDSPGKREKVLQELNQPYWSYGDSLTAVAGDGSTLLYAVVSTDILRGSIDVCKGDGGGTCVVGVDKWSLKRVVGRRAIAVPGAPAAFLLAFFRDRMALVPANLSRVKCHGDTCPGAYPRALRRFEIRSLTGGRILAKRGLDGVPTAIALSDRFVAVLVRDADLAWIEYFSARTGAPKGKKTVPRAAADELSISGTRIAWHLGKVIHVFDAATGVDSAVVSARSKPIGLTIESRRIVWAERSGLVRSLLLPS
jgi:hypothetical protein